jgi:hypothetical protein
VFGLEEGVVEKILFMSNHNKFIIIFVTLLLMCSGIFVLNQTRNLESAKGISSIQIVSNQNTQLIVDSHTTKTLIPPPDFRNLSESDRLYYSGTLGSTSSIILKIGKHPVHHRDTKPFYAEYKYIGVSEDYISMEGDLVGGIFEFIEKPNAIVKIDPTTKSGSWSDGKNTYPISLEEFVVDPTEPNKNPIEVGLLKKYRKVISDYFDLGCETSGKLNVGGCGLYDKKGSQLNYIESLGFPKILDSNKEYTNLEFNFNGYGVCAYRKLQINNSNLTFKELESYNGDICQKKYVEKIQYKTNIFLPNQCSK